MRALGGGWSEDSTSRVIVLPVSCRKRTVNVSIKVQKEEKMEGKIEE